jgi:hypothetical protein
MTDLPCRVRWDVWSDASPDPSRETVALCLTHVLSAHSDQGKAHEMSLMQQADQARDLLRRRHIDADVRWTA